MPGEHQAQESLQPDYSRLGVAFRPGREMLGPLLGLLLILIGLVSIAWASIGISTEDSSDELTVIQASGVLVIALGLMIVVATLLGSSTQQQVASVSEARDLEHTVVQLARNYDLLRRQATQGFILAGIFMALGVGVVLVGVVGFLFDFTRTSSSLTVMSGVVIDLVSILGFYLFRQTFHRMNTVSDRLHDTWRLLTAFDRAELLPDAQKAEMMVTLITALAQPSGDSTVPEARTRKKRPSTSSQD